MKRTQRSLLTLLVATFVGCNHQPNPVSTTSSIDLLQKENHELRRQLKALEPMPAELELLQSEYNKLKLEHARSEEQRLALSAALRKKKQTDKPELTPFTDLENCFAKEQIRDLQRLGVFQSQSEKFRPHDPISRAEYVTWAFRAYSAIQPSNKIRLAESKMASFSDVPPNHPSYGYIQGLQDAGFVVGYDEKTFRPDRLMSREEFVALKTSIDGFTRAYGGFGQLPFADKYDISKKYHDSFLKERTNGMPNIEKAFGQLKDVRPQQKMTRAEAAASLWSFGGSWHQVHTAAQALKR